MSNRIISVLLVTVVLLSTGVGVAAPQAGAGHGSDDGVAADLDAATTGVAKVSSPDGDLQSGSSFWRGWQLRLDATTVLDAPDGDRAFELWRVTEDGQLNQQVETLAVDESGTHVVDTGSLEGRFVILYGGEPVYVHQGRAYLASPPDGSPVTVETSAFGVDRQTLSFDWGDPEVFPGQHTTLSVSSNRDSYVLAVSVDGLSFENLTTLLPETSYATNHDARAGQNQLLIEVDSQSDLLLNTSVFEPGTRRLAVEVVDATASATVSLTVNEPDPDHRFRSTEWSENVGDTFEVELVCNHCYLVVGTPEQDMVDVLELRDSNGDGTVNVRINTRYVGQYTGASGYPSHVDPYTSPDDEVNRYSPSTTLESIDNELTYSVNQLGKLRDRLGLDPNGRDRPVEPGTLDLTVAKSDFLIARSSWGSRSPFGSDLVVRDETDARTVELEPRSLGGVQSMAAPGGAGFESTAERLDGRAAPRGQVALGDRLVFRIDVSGVFGYFSEHGTSRESLRGNEDEGIDLTIHRLPDTSGGSEERIRFDRTEVEFVADPESDSLYVVLRTGGPSTSRLDAGRYRLRFTLEGVPGRHSSYSTLNAHDGYPYLDSGQREVVSETVTLAPSVATITDPSKGESPHLTAEGELVLQGKTTVAPGDSLWVRATSTEYSWDTTIRGRVDNTGKWTGTFDLGDAPGDEFVVTVSRGSESLAEEMYTVRPAPVEEDDDGTSGGADDGASGDGEGGGPIVGGGEGTLLSAIPNFAIYGGGGIGALAVVWGAWRLVIRRLLL